MSRSSKSLRSNVDHEHLDHPIFTRRAVRLDKFASRDLESRRSVADQNRF